MRVLVDLGQWRKGQIVAMSKLKAMKAALEGWAEPAETRETAVAETREVR